MMLVTPVHSSLVTVTCRAPTVIEPRERLTVDVRISATQTCEVIALDWQPPSTLSLTSRTGASLPTRLSAGQSLDIQSIFQSLPQDGFGELRASLGVHSLGGSPGTVTWTIWVSVFKRAIASDRDRLNDELRHRLIRVVNARPRNGHIFLADFVKFFDDFLNIEVPASIADVVSRDLMLPSENLPLDLEVRNEIILGRKTFYGIDVLELIAEEECEESDDRFDARDAREVAH